MNSSLLAAYGGEKALQDELHRAWPIIETEDAEAVIEALFRKHWSYYSSSEEIGSLERQICARLNRPFALALNSGTSALFVAFFCLDLRLGDEVLVPTYTFPATVAPLLHFNTSIVFYDTAPHSPVPDLSHIASRVTSRTKAIVVSHMDGFPAAMDEIVCFAHARGILVIEDCAQSLGAVSKGREVGQVGDLAAFSFTEKKVAVGGEGGMLVMTDRRLYERAILVSYLQKRAYEEVRDPVLREFCYTGLGLNLRMHPFAAALASQQFKRVDAVLEARAAARLTLKSILGNRKELFWPSPPTVPERLGEYSIKLLVRDDIDPAEYVRLLAAEGVPVVQSETQPLHTCAAFVGHMVPSSPLQNEFHTDPYPNARYFSERAIRLPALSAITSTQSEQIKTAFDKVGDYLTPLGIEG